MSTNSQKDGTNDGAHAERRQCDQDKVHQENHHCRNDSFRTIIDCDDARSAGHHHQEQEEKRLHKSIDDQVEGPVSPEHGGGDTSASSSSRGRKSKGEITTQDKTKSKIFMKPTKCICTGMDSRMRRRGIHLPQP